MEMVSTASVGGVGARLAIDLHQTLHEDVLDLLAGQCVLQPVAQQDDERQALTQLVRTGGRARGPTPPSLSSIQCLPLRPQVLLGTASHTARAGALSARPAATGGKRLRRAFRRQSGLGTAELRESAPSAPGVLTTGLGSIQGTVSGAERRGRQACPIGALWLSPAEPLRRTACYARGRPVGAR